MEKFNPSKKLGQNFLINPQIPIDIVDKINFDGVDLIIEIGPGTGALTKELVKKNIPMTAIELDKRLYATIKNEYLNINVINDDVLKVDFQNIIKGYKNPIIVSNLPYSISSPMIFKFIKEIGVNVFYCMLQKEVVDRLCAKPRTHQYNAFTVIVSYCCNIKNIINVGRNNFSPVPKVDSAVVSIVKKPKQTYINEFDLFLKKCFCSKRQMLVNNLKNVYTKQIVIDALSKHNIGIKSRAEELNVEELFKLYSCLSIV
ncbi:ribosomal RNA small subunit methyltransferase A [Bacilli bacterium]|nr:ribosomal RNA small subunit methyltransferase A [Bacilli bacterium]